MTHGNQKRRGVLFAIAFLLVLPIVALAETQQVVPKLSIDIPGVTLSGVTKSGNAYIIPWLAQYLLGIQKYLIAVATFLAAVFIIIGGLQIAYAGGNASTASSGKKKISNALAGLVVAAASSMILYLINPDLISLKALTVKIVEPKPLNLVNDRYAANSLAPDTLREVISEMTPEEQENARRVIEESKKPIDLDIPRTCPGRDPSYRPEDWVMVGGRRVMPLKNYSMSYHGKTLDENAIQFWLAEQKRSGVPAAVMIAQMLTETGNPGKCAAINPGGAASCGGAAARNYNFGGVGCTNRQVPSGCGHAAFPIGAIDINTRQKINGLTCADANNGLGSVCKSICEASGGVQNVNLDCGPNCYPQPSNFSRSYQGKEVWFPSLQCSRKYNSLSEFLNSHLGFVRFCLPYNDSVYKFAYCIGASTYAGTTGSKATILAQIIERNCLCDPEKDSLGCKRNMELEDKLSKSIIKKRNLNLFAHECEVERQRTGSAFTIGTCSKASMNSGIDYIGIIEALRESTGGLLDVSPPQDDLGLTVMSEE